MKHFGIIAFVLFCFVFKTNGQNLVPNSSFENHSDCNNIYIYNAIPWCLSSSNGGSSAFYNPCQSDPLFRTPVQYNDPCFQSYQLPRTGLSYIDMGNYVQSSIQESVVPQVKLIDTLKANKIYCVTYYVSVWNNAKYTIDKLGALLTPTPFPCFVAGGPTVAIAGNYTPQVVTTPGVAIGDTLNWTEVSGSFTAAGNEAYLAIGDFFTHAQHYIQNTYPTNCNGLALYYVDDVSVEEVEIAKAKNDTLIMQGDSAMIGLNNSEAALFSWQPTTGLSCSNCPNPKASPTITTTYTVTKTQCKTVTSDMITVTVSPVGIDELSMVYGVQAKIYPNPNNGSFMLAYDLKKYYEANVQIADVTGKIVFNADIDNMNSILNINTNQLQSGIYFIQLTKGKQLLWTDKVMISK